MKLSDILGLKKSEAKPKKFMLEIIALAVLAAVLIITATPIIAYEFMYEHKIYMGVYADGVSLGGLNKTQAIDLLNRNFDNIRQAGLTFNYADQNYNLSITTVSPTDPDLAFEILTIKIEDMAESAFKYGRNGDWSVRLREQLSALLVKEEMPVKYNLNEAELKKSLQQKFSSMEQPVQNTRLDFSDGIIKVLAPINGNVIDYDEAIFSLKKNINLVEIKPIIIKTKPQIAVVTQAEAEALLPQVKDIINLGQLVLKYQPEAKTGQDKIWTIKSEEYKNWLSFDKVNGQTAVIFDQKLMAQKLSEIANEINVAPQDAKFQMTDGKVTEFKPALPGLELDQEQTLKQINQEFIVNKNKELNLAVKESAPHNKTEDSNTLGIKELIGKGVSDFAGSHTNRIKNIKNAVAHLNGIIIPPGEFSIVDAIGDVTAETGYFPEFVIKGDRTLPEYGGGLCQIGTTVFRAALYSGLPITERRPHSYIVSYYKPLGMDATIYGPHPDLRFLNDTGHNILLQIKIDGTQLTFEFWGTSDGRKVEITDPQLYNWTAQPADRLIENPELKPGAKILKETGRRGADSHFYRYITKADGTKAEEIFRSHYVPWPNIYEVGVTPKVEGVPATDTAAEPSTSDSATAGQSGSNDTNINSAQ
jgi:vancomycin resistance protein YoaR